MKSYNVNSKNSDDDMNEMIKSAKSMKTTEDKYNDDYTKKITHHISNTPGPIAFNTLQECMKASYENTHRSTRSNIEHTLLAHLHALCMQPCRAKV